MGSRNERNIPPLELPNEETATKNKHKASLLNEFFAKQSRMDMGSIQLPTLIKDRYDVPELTSITVTGRETLSILNKLKVHKSCGPDVTEQNIKANSHLNSGTID